MMRFTLLLLVPSSQKVSGDSIVMSNIRDYRIAHMVGNRISIKQVLSGDMETLERIASEVDGFIIKVQDLPERSDRGAWKLDVENQKITIDMDVIAEGVLRNIRAIRNHKLSELDVPSIRAIEDGDTEKSAEIKAKKQELRDLPENVEQRLAKITGNKRKKDATKLKELREFRVPELED